MRYPAVTLKKNNLLVIDNLLSNTEADILAKAAFNKPTGTEETYLWNQIYSLQHGNTLPYNHNARSLYEQVQFRCLQIIKNEIELPTLRIEYTGIAISNKAYSYHADNSYPEEESKRDLGIPSDITNDFSSYFNRSNDTWGPGAYPTRYYSTILFLNSDFTGGQEVFPQHTLEVTPRQGRLVAYPSTKEYIHGNRKTFNGNRYSIHTWYNKVFNYYDQKKNESTKNLDILRDIYIAIEENKLLINV